MSLRSITATYPGFHALPRGIKKMLLASESEFFDEARAPSGLPHGPAIVRQLTPLPRRTVLGNGSVTSAETGAISLTQ